MRETTLIVPLLWERLVSYHWKLPDLSWLLRLCQFQWVDSCIVSLTTVTLQRHFGPIAKLLLDYFKWNKEISYICCKPSATDKRSFWGISMEACAWQRESGRQCFSWYEGQGFCEIQMVHRTRLSMECKTIIRCIIWLRSLIRWPRGQEREVPRITCSRNSTEIQKRSIETLFRVVSSKESNRICLKFKLRSMKRSTQKHTAKSGFVSIDVADLQRAECVIVKLVQEE